MCFNWRLITSRCCGGFCLASAGISHGCIRVPHPEPPPAPIPLGYPRAPALGALLHSSSLYGHLFLHMVVYRFQCYFPKSSYPRLLPQRQKLFLYICVSLTCLAYRVIVPIFLCSIYICVNILCRCFSREPFLNDSIDVRGLLLFYVVLAFVVLCVNLQY